MLPAIGVAIGAGVASGLLFAVASKGTTLAMALAYLSPLPAMIAALGWGGRANLIAALVSAGAVAGLVDPLSGVIFGLTVAAPGALLVGVARLYQRNPFAPGAEPNSPVRPGLGAITLTAAGFGFAVSAGAIAVMIVDHGGYAPAIADFRAMLQPTLEEAMTSGGDLPEGVTVEDLGRLVLRYAPAAIAASTTLMLLINLYIAARTAQLSERLPRPWLEIPDSLRLPALAGLVTLAAAAGWYFAPEPYNPFVAALAAPLLLLFLLQGLATLHALSRRTPGRPAVIIALYLALMLAPRWIGVAVCALGLAESALKLRARAAARPPRTPPAREWNP